MSLPWIATLFFLLLVCVLSFSYLLTSFNGKNNQPNYSRNRLPPGPPGLPIIGNLHMLGSLPHRNLDRLAQKYGPIMSIRLGKVSALVVSSPKMAELFLKTHDNIFASRHKVQVAKYLSYGLKGIAFSPNGSYWRKTRKLCSLHLLSTNKIESFNGVRKEEVRMVVESIRVVSESDRGLNVNLSEKVGSIVENVTCRMVLGVKVNKFDLKPIVREATRVIGGFNLADYLPFIGVLDLQGLKRRVKAVSKTIDELFEKMIDEHVQDARKQKDDHRDFVDVLISIMDSKEENEQLNRDNIKAIMLDMILGAIDTTVTAIEWALSELLRQPRVMKLLQKELETLIGMDRMVEETDLDKLKYLEMVVKESMRLHPVAPLLNPHESTQDIKIDGYDIPKKTVVIVNVWSIGRDQNVWSQNAGEFYPERFADIDITLEGHDFRLIPFGSGRRGCPGMELGLTMVRLILAQLVHCFDWELPNGMLPNELDMTEKLGLSVPRATPLVAIPKYRLVKVQK